MGRRWEGRRRERSGREGKVERETGEGIGGRKQWVNHCVKKE